MHHIIATEVLMKKEIEQMNVRVPRRIAKAFRVAAAQMVRREVGLAQIFVIPPGNR